MIKAIAIATFLCVFFLLQTFPAHAGVACGGTTCPEHYLCLDRGDGESCWMICQTNLQCPTTCCTRISVPYTAWICGTEDDCGMTTTTDGDGGTMSDGDVTYSTDGDDGNSVETSDCGENTCTSWELCIVIESGRTACASLCESDSDCSSGCCADVVTGDKVCLPADMDCPRGSSSSSTDGDDTEEDDDSGSDSPFSCGNQTGAPSLWFWLILLTGARLTLWFTRRKGLDRFVG